MQDEQNGIPDLADNPPPRFEEIPLDEKIRCHPVMIAEFVLQGLIIGIFVGYWVSAGISEKFMINNVYSFAAALAMILASFLWVGYWRWKRTTVTFMENEMLVLRDTVFKLNKRIPYSKIASVNVNRGILNQITGTTKLLFNVNSAVNAAIPEVSLIFGIEMADRIRSNLSGKMYDNNLIPEDEESIPSLMEITTKDIVFHSFLSQSTIVSVYGLIFFVVGLIEIIYQGFTAEFALVSLMFVFGYVFPIVLTMFRYYDYKIYRIGDTIYIRHGLIREFRTSFKINKINAIIISSPLFPRVIKKKMIRAEVVGLGSSGGEENGETPLLCPLKDAATVEKVIDALVPELAEKFENRTQPREAAKPVLIRAALWSIATIVSASAIIMLLSDIFVLGYYRIVLLAIPVLLSAAYFVYGIHSLKVLKYGMGSDAFSIVTGVIDRTEMTMYYDKVQIASVENGPLSRPWNLAKCEVSLLSAMGAKKVKSGYFKSEDLEKIPDEVVGRIKDGRYDYRKYL